MAAGRARTGWALVCAAALSIVSVVGTRAEAQVIPLDEIPADLPKDLGECLKGVKEGLGKVLAKLSLDNAQFLEFYGMIPDDSPDVTKAREKQAELEARLARYNAGAERFNGMVKVAKGIRDLKGQVAKDQEAIHNLGLKTRAEDFEEWERLADDARKEFEEQALASFVELLFTGASDANAAVAAKAGSLNTFSAQKLIGKLKAAGVKNDRIFQVVKEIGATKGKPERAKAAAELIDMLEKETDLMEGARDVSARPNDTKTQAEVIADVLSWGLTGPLAGWFASEVQLTFASVYNYEARTISMANVERLTALTDEQLKSLGILSNLLKKHVSEVRDARKGFDESCAALKADIEASPK